MDTRTINDMLIVKFTDADCLETENLPPTTEQLNEVLQQNGEATVVLNLENINYLASSALGVLATTHKELEALGRQIRLCCLSPPIREVFDVMQLTRIFTIYDTEAEAIDSE